MCLEDSIHKVARVFGKDSKALVRNFDVLKVSISIEFLTRDRA